MEQRARSCYIPGRRTSGQPWSADPKPSHHPKMSAGYFFRHILWRLIVTLLAIPLLLALTGGAMAIGVGMVCVIGLLWAAPLAHGFAETAGGILMPSDDHFEVKPQYSIAEARVREGDYEAAIEVYHRYAELYPDDVTPHMRIAELHIERFKDPEAAIETLKQALPRAREAEPFALIHFRLADIHVAHGGRTSEALYSLREIQRVHPKTKPAAAALERASKLLKKQAEPPG